MKIRKIYKNLLLVVLIDLCLLSLSIYGAYLLRFDFFIPQKYSHLLNQLLPFVLFSKIIIFYYFDLYSGMWRYTSIADLFNVIKAAVVSTLLIVIVILFLKGFRGVPRSVFIIDWGFTIFLISGFRLGIRLFFERSYIEKGEVKNGWTLFSIFKKNTVKRKRLLIVGAGDCGEKIYREIRDNASLGYRVVGFLDDDLDKKGMKLHGVPVLSHVGGISVAAKRVNADEALIAIPSATAHQMREIISYCKECGLKFRTVPGMGELINGKVSVNAIRDVAYRDLLGREVINLDTEKIGAYLKGQTVLVTGAGGSIGSELCRQMCRFMPKTIVLYDRAESPLYEIELELKKNFKGIKVVPVLADIQDRNQIEKTFESYQPQTVFHAAAYKHVPMLELQPWLAVKNNIQGTMNMIEASCRNNIGRFVFVSTDKAVRPTNVMGATKRVSEMLVQGHGSCNAGTRFMIVRFGNVVGSVGSVVPLFKKQIEKGGPVTVTHPDVTRYFMTIPEACQLILQAGTLGNGDGNDVDIFIFDMGTPIKIVDMARDLIRFSGFEPDVDIKIEFVGLRPGEKLYEELITGDEGIVPTTHEKIMVLRGKGPDLDSLKANIHQLLVFAEDQDTDKIKGKLMEVVAEYKPANIN